MRWKMLKMAGLDQFWEGTQETITQTYLSIGCRTYIQGSRIEEENFTSILYSCSA